ncbi:MAG: hypothetical protein AAB361_02450 [Patescibacteria group bacterium]
MANQINKTDVLKTSLILLVLISSIIFLYSPHFKTKLGGYDVMELYREAQNRNTFKKIIDYKYFSQGGGPTSAYFNPVILLVWRQMATNYDKNHFFYHLLCTLIHIINTMIVFFLLKAFIKNNLFSFLATLSFTIYYLNFLTVGWIASGINQGLTIFLVLSALLSVIKYFQTKNTFFYFLSLLSFFLGTFTKEIAIFTIPILLAYYIIIQREKIFKFIKPDLILLPYLILSLPIILITFARMNGSAVITSFGGINFGAHMLYRFLDYVNYMITIIPASHIAKITLAMFILFLLPFLIYYGLRDKKLLFLTIWLALSIAIFIFSNFRDIYDLGRYLYLPSIAWFAMLYYIASNIKNLKTKIISSFFLINYTIVLNLFLILTRK